MQYSAGLQGVTADSVLRRQGRSKEEGSLRLCILLSALPTGAQVVRSAVVLTLRLRTNAGMPLE